MIISHNNRYYDGRGATWTGVRRNDAFLGILGLHVTVNSIWNELAWKWTSVGHYVLKCMLQHKCSEGASFTTWHESACCPMINNSIDNNIFNNITNTNDNIDNINNNIIIIDIIIILILIDIIIIIIIIIIINFSNIIIIIISLYHYCHYTITDIDTTIIIIIIIIIIIDAIIIININHINNKVLQIGKHQSVPAHLPADWWFQVTCLRKNACCANLRFASTSTCTRRLLYQRQWALSWSGAARLGPWWCSARAW